MLTNIVMLVNIAHSQEPTVRFTQQANTRFGDASQGAAARGRQLDRAEQLLTPLADITLRPQTKGLAPKDYALQAFHETAQPDSAVLKRNWQLAHSQWAPTSLWHKPLYFEDVNLERHGLSFGIAQPAVSATRFVGNVVALPYHMVRQHPHDCVYDLGHCRPGNCVPFYRHHAPFDKVAGLAEAGTLVGMVLLIP